MTNNCDFYHFDHAIKIAYTSVRLKPIDAAIMLGPKHDEDKRNSAAVALLHEGTTMKR
jgi:hypothetical protein